MDVQYNEHCWRAFLVKGKAYSDILYLNNHVSNLASCNNFHTQFFLPFKNNFENEDKNKEMRCLAGGKKKNVKCSPGTKVFKFVEAVIQVSDVDLPDR